MCYQIQSSPFPLWIPFITQGGHYREISFVGSYLSQSFGYKCLKRHTFHLTIGHALWSFVTNKSIHFLKYFPPGAKSSTFAALPQFLKCQPKFHFNTSCQSTIFKRYLFGFVEPHKTNPRHDKHDSRQTQPLQQEKEKVE